MTPEFYEVANWRSYQHYTKRNPPWIKLHVSLLTSPQWVMLADASKALAVASMLIASRHDGKIPNDPAYMKRVCYLQSCNFKPLVDSGFLIPLADASKLLASACLSVSVSESVFSEGEESEERGDDFADQVIADLNRRTGSRFGAGKATRSMINARRREGASLEDFLAVHDVKVKEWGKSDKMRGFLRPKTLYAASNWEDYLGQAKGKLSRPKPSAPIAGAHPIDFAEVEMSDEERERVANEAKEAMAELTKRLGGQVVMPGA